MPMAQTGSVGDHGVLRCSASKRQAAGNLLADHGFGFIGFTLGESFAHTDDRLEAGGQGGLGLGVDQGVAFLWYSRRSEWPRIT